MQMSKIFKIHKNKLQIINNWISVFLKFVNQDITIVNKLILLYMNKFGIMLIKFNIKHCLSKKYM